MTTRHFKTLWSEEKCLEVLSKYHKRCKKYKRRPRGNPSNVIHAVQCLRNMFEEGRFCEVCGKTKRVELHHLDDNWRNYTPENLRFLCRQHHFEHHAMLEEEKD